MLNAEQVQEATRSFFQTIKDNDLTESLSIESDNMCLKITVLTVEEKQAQRARKMRTECLIFEHITPLIKDLPVTVRYYGVVGEGDNEVVCGQNVTLTTNDANEESIKKMADDVKRVIATHKHVFARLYPVVSPDGSSIRMRLITSKD